MVGSIFWISPNLKFEVTNNYEPNPNKTGLADQIIFTNDEIDITFNKDQKIHLTKDETNHLVEHLFLSLNASPFSHFMKRWFTLYDKTTNKDLHELNYLIDFLEIESNNINDFRNELLGIKDKLPKNCPACNSEIEEFSINLKSE